MTDPLTDAVRRLKELQQDVERLQSGQDEEGEPRLFFNAQEQAVGDDTLAVIGADERQTETAVADDQQTDLRTQREVGANVNHFQWGTSTWNFSTWNGTITRPEIEKYDLSSPGTLVELRDVGETTSFGFTLKATTPATFVVESVPETAGPFRVGTFENTTVISSGFDAPEATAIRLRNTTTATGTADAIANARGALEAGQRGKNTVIPTLRVANRPENANYDLSTTDTIVSVRAAESASTYGFTLQATAPATFVVELIGATRGIYETQTFSNTTAISSGFEAPEADAVRIRNTTTASGTVDAILNVDENQQ
jgi:hypothetical protein